MLLFKWVALSGILYIGLFFYNQNVAYKNCFKIMQMAELAMLLAASAKLIYFIFNTPQTIQDVQYFYPLAITQFFTLKQIASYLVYPLQQFNLFELGYWVLITSGIQTFTQKNFWQSLKITASSYGVAMFIWLLFIVFIQLQFS
ncbi:MAG: hypothetical protein KGO81_03280 [Bacteroidota bacterium]|nr:hypothetical protein [Bacteroidota bacterium]